MLCQRCIGRQIIAAAPVGRRCVSGYIPAFTSVIPFSIQVRTESRSYTHSALPKQSSGSRWASAKAASGIHSAASWWLSERRGPSSCAWGQQTRSAVTLVRKPAEPEEPDVFKSGDPDIILTERAQEKLKQVSETEKNPNLALRIAVEPGGCHGYQYKMELTDEAEDDDFHFKAAEGVTLFIDSVSLNLVKGSTIDFVTELIGSQFAIKDNPQAKGAGCGCGVSWEPII
ncbi:hypothetical protein K437DRAFT_251935 [Tilletiaria anomala UBC 951]|uniref:Core domain-containing protein n=1 Tax=Tilletiaria anomala (strain ATCC 24038 / CBS 436.72 / UBC 951) TaxID=1037660 RepID=A0A066VFH0_TILAU|nr:uncharacterized protein K437DRAFT_251935 [Tilletiaria anomala UBC 951]KDN37315.1 hypothetical protein K437DRAFT_251935 [Tilletiaria anomala UBC 951]